MKRLTVNDLKNLSKLIDPKIQNSQTVFKCFAQICDNYDKGRVPKSGVSKHFRCLKEVRLFPKI